MTAADKMAKVAAAMTENDLLDTTAEMAVALGWFVYHPRPGRTAVGWRTPLQGHPGFPDLMMVRAGWLIAAELKSTAGLVTVAQREWARRLGTVGGGVLVFTWRPADLLDGSIRGALTDPLAHTVRDRLRMQTRPDGPNPR